MREEKSCSTLKHKRIRTIETKSFSYFNINDVGVDFCCGIVHTKSVTCGSGR